MSTIYGFPIICTCNHNECLNNFLNTTLTICENRSCAEIISPENSFRLLKTDVCIPSFKKHGFKMCDYFLMELNSNDHYYIELKGMDYKIAFEQIENIYSKFSSKPEYSYRNRYAVVSISYLTYNPNYLFFKKKFQDNGWKVEYIKSDGNLYNFINQSPIKIKI